MKQKKQNQKGFTVIELLVVIAIIGLLASIVFVVLRGATEQAKLAKSIEGMRQVYLAATLYAEDNNGTFPGDEDPGVAPDFISQYMSSWPISGCAPDIVFDWDSWLTHKEVDANGNPWTPIVRVSLRRIVDDTTIYYFCILPNQKGKCTCEDVHFAGDCYCKGYAPIQNAPPGLTCDDLKSTDKFPSFPP